uniref:Ovule protein n=1 Tax=Loa loa TaxID=7209 RepID=A0A1I7W348_LOALO
MTSRNFEVFIHSSKTLKTPPTKTETIRFQKPPKKQQSRTQRFTTGYSRIIDDSRRRSTVSRKQPGIVLINV